MAADLKMYCIISQEALNKMQGNRGKMMAQAGHAFLHAWWDAEDRCDNFEWDDNMRDYAWGNDARKIILIAPTDDDLRNLVNNYKDVTGVALIEDCGYTIFEPGTLTVTCAGIGPLRDKDKQDDLRQLPTFS